MGKVALMPIIQFDVLVPDEQSEKVRGVFQTAVDKLVQAGRMTSANVELVTNPKLPEGLADQLRQVYRDEHDGQDLEFASVYRYPIAVEGLNGSINQLAMVLSRLLTPHAELPQDYVLLENEKDYELPAIFPWTLEILR